MTAHYKSRGQIDNPLPPLEQNVLYLSRTRGWLPSQILAEDERWIDLILLDDDARARAAQK